MMKGMSEWTTFDSVPGGFEVTADGARELSFTCPRCGMTSHNRNDIREGYCGNCHDWTGKPRLRHSG